MARKRVYFGVSFILPEGASVATAKGYVLEAVASMHGCYEPPNEDNHWTGDPMFDLDGDTVVVTGRPRKKVKNP